MLGLQRLMSSWLCLDAAPCKAYDHASDIFSIDVCLTIFNRLTMYGYYSDRFGPMTTEVKPRRTHTTRKRTARPSRNDRPEQVCVSSRCFNNKQSHLCFLFGA